MKIYEQTNNVLLLQRKTDTSYSSLEKQFAKLKVDYKTELLEDKLKALNLKDDGKLIERGPIKDTKVPNNKPYQKVTENVNIRHNSGGTAFCITSAPQENNDNINVYYNNFENKCPKSDCSECFDLLECDHCILQVANSPEFKQHYETVLQQNIIQETQPNITSEIQIYPVLINPSLRRISYDSGFQSDNPSPRSDCVLSPKSPFTLKPSKIETVTSSYRKILPKTEDMQKTKTKPEQTKKTIVEISAKEKLRATLNPEIKQVKWVEIVTMKNIKEIFETNPNGQTILHKMLQSNDQCVAESLYAIVEKMKMNPDRCTHIIAAQSSICDVIKQKKHPQLWMDYFCEAVQIIKLKMEKSRN